MRFSLFEQSKKTSWLASIIFTSSVLSFGFQEFVQSPSPNWDEASYLLEGESIRVSFSESPIHGLVGLFTTNSTGRPPFLSWIAALFVFDTENYQVFLSITKIAIWIVWLISLNCLYRICLTSNARYFAFTVASFSNLAISIGHQFLTDLLVVSFVQLSLYFFIKFYKESSNRFLYWSAFFIAISFLTKPTAIILSAPVFTYLIWLTSKSRKLTESALLLTKFILCALGIVLPWLILNWENLLGYGNKQVSFPRYLYVYAPDNARSFSGIFDFITLLLRSTGVVFWTALTLITFSFFSLLLGIKRREASAPLGTCGEVKVNCTLVAALLMIPAIYFEWSLLWETRYSLIFISGMSLLLGLLWEKFQQQVSWRKLGPVFLLIASITAQQITNDPSKWSQPLKDFFYSNEIRSVLSNFGISLIDYGRLPSVRDDVAINVARSMSTILKSDEIIGLGLSHPELNSITLSWAQKSLGLPANQFVYLTYKTIGQNWFIEDQEDLIEKRVLCSDYAIFPIENDLPNLGWSDIVDFQNRNIFNLDRSKRSFDKIPLLRFSASIPLGVASNQRQIYGLFKQKRFKALSDKECGLLDPSSDLGISLNGITR